MGKEHTRGAICLAFLLVCSASAFALGRPPDLSQYAHTVWSVRDGFTRSAINALAQTPDGYLWLGTELGLVRFDGMRAVPWQPPRGEQLPSNYVEDLLVARDGTLWISTLKGLASWKNGNLTQYPEVAGQVVFSLLEDRAGTVWLGLVNPGRLCALRAGKIQCYGAGTLGRGVDALYEDHNGNLWVAATTGLWRWASGPAEHYPLPPVVNRRALIEIEGGSLLVGTSDGLKLLSNRRIQSYAVNGVTGSLSAVRFLRPRDGSLWIGSEQGLLRLNRGESDSFAATDGLSSDYVKSVLEDREGNVWVATSGGLDRFREYLFPTISVNQGLSSSTNWSVQATLDGSIWIGTPNGLNRWRDGQVSVYGRRNVPGGVGRGIKPGRSGKGLFGVVANSGLSGGVLSLGLDDRGRLLVSTTDHLFSFDGARFTPVPGIPGGNVFATDIVQKTVWVGSYDLGLFRSTPRNMVERIPWSQLGQGGGWARALAADPLQGGVWLGFFDGGVAYFKDGTVRASYTVADGLGRGRVNHLRLDADGVLWASTEGGLSRLKDGRFSTLTSRNGLPCDEVHWTIEDNDHAFWLYMPCGLVRIARAELDAWASESKRTIGMRVFDALDGARTVGVYGTVGPRVTKAADGKIWFVPFDGVTVIDPHRLALDSSLPPVQIEQITADGKSYDASSPTSGRIRLPPRTRNLAIDYTALSLSVPEKVRFRFRLEGQDKEWREVVNQRRVEYSNLPPGDYHFRLTASNNSGVWNEAGTLLDFSIAAAYYQTNWFRALCAAVSVTLLWCAHQLRLRRISRQLTMRLEERMDERIRIAQELHDTLLQGLHSASLQLEIVNTDIAADHPAKSLTERVLQLLRQLVDEGRNTLRGLRQARQIQDGDLAQELARIPAELMPGSMRFHLVVEGEPRALRALVHDEVYRIGREALVNAFRHSRASLVEAVLEYTPRHFRLVIRDDGEGIAPRVLHSGRAGHWGLTGIRERSLKIGARLKVRSAPKAGTEIDLIVAAGAAFADAMNPTWTNWLLKLLPSPRNSLNNQHADTNTVRR